MHSKRARRVATCTALALSAGMLLSGPASADSPAPLPKIEKEAPSFTPPKLTLPTQGAARADVASATAAPLSDLDGDGYEDVIFRATEGDLFTATSTQVSAFFELPRIDDVAKDIVPIGNQGGATTEPEVLVLSENGTLKLYQDAAPSGTPYESVVGSGWQTYNKVVSPGDVNGDGRADVVARAHDGKLYLYLATGNLTQPLGVRKLVGSGWQAYDQIVGANDVNGDGLADMYARDPGGTVWFYAGTGDTTNPFGTRKSVGVGWGLYNQILPAGNGNLLARDNAGTLFHYASNTDGTLAARQPSSASGEWAGITQFAGAGSIPYTGKEGIYATTPNGALYWYYNSTTGKLDPRMEILGAGGLEGLSPIHLSSMNPDSLSDIALVMYGDLYIEGNEIGSGWGVYNTLVGPGDLTNDGKGDLLARDRAGYLYLYAGNGAGTKLSGRVKIGSGWGAYNALAGAGDYTGDGRMDLVARTTGGDLYLYAGTGVAASPFATRKYVGSGWNAYSKLIAPGDLNADGKGDLLGVTAGGEVYRYLGTTPGKFSARYRINTGFGIYNSIS
ncbi:FG-GAP repeat domain-containing protein [Streptomyces sp. NPDC093795]|uniref:FG-GAP repeat domain-containing protein n=1 Tax=Streptomyces sp. NPDC093795 TaxID=3366051 RepID=UPI00382F00F6